MAEMQESDAQFETGAGELRPSAAGSEVSQLAFAASSSMSVNCGEVGSNNTTTIHSPSRIVLPVMLEPSQQSMSSESFPSRMDDDADESACRSVSTTTNSETIPPAWTAGNQMTVETAFEDDFEEGEKEEEPVSQDVTDVSKHHQVTEGERQEQPGNDLSEHEETPEQDRSPSTSISTSTVVVSGTDRSSKHHRRHHHRRRDGTSRKKSKSRQKTTDGEPSAVAGKHKKRKKNEDTLETTARLDQTQQEVEEQTHHHSSSSTACLATDGSRLQDQEEDPLLPAFPQSRTSSVCLVRSGGPLWRIRDSDSSDDGDRKKHHGDHHRSSSHEGRQRHRSDSTGDNDEQLAPGTNHDDSQREVYRITYADKERGRPNSNKRRLLAEESCSETDAPPPDATDDVVVEATIGDQQQEEVDQGEDATEDAADNPDDEAVEDIPATDSPSTLLASQTVGTPGAPVVQAMSDDVLIRAVESKVKRCLSVLAPLLLPIDKPSKGQTTTAAGGVSTTVAETKVTTEQLESMLTAMDELWTSMNPESSAIQISKELITTVELCLNLRSSAPHLPNPPQLEDIIDTRLQEPFWRLRARLLQSGMMRNKYYRHSIRTEQTLGTTYVRQRAACEAYYNIICYRNKNFDFQLDQLNPDQTLGLMRYLPETQLRKYKPQLQFLMFCLNRCQERHYRRHRGCIYKPKYTAEGWFTNYYERKCTITEWVWRVCDISSSFHMFVGVYGSGKTALCEPVIHILENVGIPHFPDLKESRYLSSWRNGVWNHGEDKFYPYDLKKKQWSGEVSLPAKPAGEEIQRCLTQLDELSATLPKYKSLFEAVKQDLEKKAKPQQQQKPPSEQGTAGDLDADGGDRRSSGSENLQQEQHFATADNIIDDDDNVYVGNTFVSSIFVDQVFVESATAWLDPVSGSLNCPWRSIKLVHFEKLLRAQGWNEDTRDWIYALLGRALYTCGDLLGENWSIAVLLLGYSGTGKSTILKLLRKFFRTDNIGVLSNNIERQWAMSSLCDKSVVLGYELKNDCGLDQAEFQSAACNEEISVARKFKDIYLTQFKSPIYMAANEMITRWKDTSGSLRRRLVVLKFEKFIKSEDVDPKLMENLEAEFCLFVQKINKAYREMVSRFSDVDIWKVLPEQIKKYNKDTMTDVHPLQDFFAKMSQRELIVTEKQAYCTWEDFQKEFKTFCHQENIDMRKMGWSDHFWRPVFDNLGLDVQTESKYDPYLECDRRDRWINGLAFVHSQPFVNNNQAANHGNSRQQQQTTYNVPKSVNAGTTMSHLLGMPLQHHNAGKLASHARTVAVSS